MPHSPRILNLLLVAGSCAIFCATLGAQQGGRGPGAGGGNTGGSGGTSGNSNTRVTTVPNYNPNSRDLALPMQPMIYNGRVLVAGTVIAQDIKVVAKCAATRTQPASVYATYTDLKGRFTFTFGQRNTGPIDASIDTADAQTPFGTNMMAQMLMCELTASAPGFIPSQMSVQFRNSLDSTEMGKLVLNPIGGGADLGGIVSVTTLSAPDGAQHEYSKGINDERNRKFANAEKHFRKAVAKYPKFALAWHHLAKLQLEAGDQAGAADSLQHAMTADPKFVPPFLDMANLAGMKNDWDQVQSLSAHAISVDSQHFPSAYFLYGVASYNTGKIADAEKAGARAEQMDKQNLFPRIHLLLAQVYNREGRRDDAAAQIRKYLAVDSTSKDAEIARASLAKLEASPHK